MIEPIHKNLFRWQDILASSIVTADQLLECLPVSRTQIQRVIDRYPMRINPYYLSLVREKNDPIWRQVVPSISELHDFGYVEDPLLEKEQSPVPNIIHRYPDRVVFLVSNRCAVFCRYCMRKRMTKTVSPINRETIDGGIAYIKEHTNVRDVILSGGDPLLLEDKDLKEIIKRIRVIPHVQIIRIHTRAPCTLPQRITKDLVNMLKLFHPLFINIHFNHPREITPQSAAACNMMADAGIPLGSQTVLLKGVNDDPATMKTLMQKLLTIRVKPYYLHQADPVLGTGHFRTSCKTGLDIMDSIRGYTSGLCVPYFMVDLPGGGGKVPIGSNYIKEQRPKEFVVENYEKKMFKYPL